MAADFENDRNRLRSVQRPPLTVEQILAWADAHRAATGSWPNAASGAVCDAPGEVWRVIDKALRGGKRGLPGGSSLSHTLDEHRPERRNSLTREQILAWADAHRAATGRWPTIDSGAVAGAPGKTWRKIDYALRVGNCGLPSGLTLWRLLLDLRARAESGSGSPRRADGF